MDEKLVNFKKISFALQKGSKGNIGIPLELWYWHFPVTPSHDFFHKIEG
jgi:hypothetical protein